MNEFLILALAGAGGAALGIIFFGGLWWTVRRGIEYAHPALLFLGSLLLRTGIILWGFYLVGHGDWRRLAACLLGFIIARFAVLRFAQPPIKHHSPLPKETNHAP